MVAFVTYFIRVGLVACWIGLIYAFLLLPSFWQRSDESASSIRIYTWAHRIDESMVRKFEQKTGIKVYLNYYESSEELLTKFEMMPSMDCDIIIPSEYIIGSLIKQNLLKKIDHKRCVFAKDIYPEFLHKYFDPSNEYSLPIYWDVFGIGYNNTALSSDQISLDLLFDRKKVIGETIGMIDDAREALFLAAQYLDIPLTGHFTQQDLEKIYNLLYQQKEWVGAYSDSQQGYYLASATFDVVSCDREIICRQMHKNDFIRFALIPQGSMLRTDSVVITASTTKDDMVYKFLNFLFSHDVQLYHAQKFCILPTLKTVFKDLDLKYIGVADLYPGSEAFKKLVTFQHGLTQKQLNDFWIRYKAS